MSNRSAPFVFFDVGGTLLVGASEVEQVVETLLFARRRVRSGDAVRDALSRARAELRDRPLSGVGGDARAAWNRELYATAFRHLALPQEAESLAAAVWESVVSHVEPPVLARGAPAALELLAEAGAKLGVISNWDESLEGILERAGLARYLEVVVSSSRIGCAKPDARIFRAALEEAGVAPEHAWHVGDDLEADARGAIAAGMRAVLLDPSGRWTQDCPRGVLRCSRVDHAARLLLDAEAGRDAAIGR